MARDDYIEVSERLRTFIEMYPKGSLDSEWCYVQRDGEEWLVVKAYAYRDQDDKRPGVGHAWEPIPGRTPYTRGSELQVGETSAWGRALAALGIAVNKGVASANEVRSAQGRAEQPDPVAAKSAEMGSYRTPSGGHRQEGSVVATPKQVGLLRSTMSKQHINEAVLADYCSQQLGFELPTDGLGSLTKAQASVIIEALLKTATAPATRVTALVEDDPWVTA